MAEPARVLDFVKHRRQREARRVVADGSWVALLQNTLLAHDWEWALDDGSMMGFAASILHQMANDKEILRPKLRSEHVRQWAVARHHDPTAPLYYIEAHMDREYLQVVDLVEEMLGLWL